jgi:hypothetical protein
MIRAGSDFIANLSTGEWSVIIEDDTKGFTVQGPVIVISQKDHLSRDYCGTCIHEAIHASRPDMTEKEVATLERDILDVIWKRGYRLPKQRKRKDSD